MSGLKRQKISLKGFFALLLEHRDLDAVRREKGRLRSYLLTSLKHFVANERDRAMAIKRGAGQRFRYGLGALRGTFERPFGSVPNSAQSLAFDSAGNLFVVDAGNAIYKFTSQTVRTPFGQTLNESFVCLAFQPPGCCE